MLNEKLSEYQSSVIQVHKLEKKIKEFFDLLAVRDNPKFARGADYGERVIEIIVPFDEINLQLLNQEKIENVKQLVSEHRQLRQKQVKLENEVAQFNAIQNNIKESIDFT